MAIDGELVRAVFPYALFATRFSVWTTVERLWRAHPFDGRAVFLADFATTLFLIYVTIPLGDRLVGMSGLRLYIPEALLALPLWARFPLYLVLADLGHYWIHRAMHTAPLWRIHKWHHVPTHMSWLAGNRESLIDRILVSLPYILLWPLVGGSARWLIAFLFFFPGIRNDWMHLNVRWRTGWLEWLIVTPRYHHVHHSVDVAHHRSNLAITFSLWDRLFGTFTPPERAGTRLAFGIGERVPLPRLVAGV